MDSVLRGVIGLIAIANIGRLNWWMSMPPKKQGPNLDEILRTVSDGLNRASTTP